MKIILVIIAFPLIFIYFCIKALISIYKHIIKRKNISSNDDYMSEYHKEFVEKNKVRQNEEKQKVVYATPNTRYGERDRESATTPTPTSKKERIASNKANAVAGCPKCGSTSLSANKKGFGLIKGAAGVVVAGPLGVVAAGKGKNKVIVTCLNCGKQFKPGK